MKKTSLKTLPLWIMAGMSLSAVATAQPAAGGALTEDSRALAEMVRKHTRVTVSSRDNLAPPTSHLYSLVLGQIIMNPADRAHISEADLRVLDALPSHRDRRFVELEQANLNRICGKLRNRGNFDVSDIALEFDSARDGREDQLLRHYEEVIGKLSSETGLYLQSRVTEAASQLSFSESRLDLFELAAEAPQMAETLLQRGCDRFESGLTRQQLRDVTLREEMANPAQAVPMTTNAE